METEQLKKDVDTISYNVAEAAAICGLKRDTIDKACYRGSLKYFRVDHCRSRLILRSELVRWIGLFSGEVV